MEATTQTMAAATCPTRFRDLRPALSDVTLKILDGMGFDRTTPVQAATIPLFTSNKDVAVEAVTGSGKTLAFLIPLVEILRRLEEPLKRHQVGAVVVSPTRELAFQIHSVAMPFVADVVGLRAMLLVGGTDVATDVASFKEEGAQVLIGTPGRLDDIMERCPAMDLRKLEVLVLDEADRLLDMGFHRPITSIIQRLPKQRRTGLFSATQTEAVEELARAGMRNAVRVEVKVQAAKKSGKKLLKAGQGAEDAGIAKTPTSLQIQYVISEADQKLGQLVHFLKEHATAKIIMYVMTCACVNYWGTLLPHLKPLRSLQIVALHGKMKQSIREKTLASFAAMPSGVLLCTDVAARGLDIPGVDWIIQYDPPQDPNAFVHRVGRTARMGRSGNAIVFLLPKEDAYVEFLKLRQVPIEPSEPMPSYTDTIAQVRREAQKDRDIMEKGVRAFVSYIRGYQEHQCKYIFGFKDLDFGLLCMGFGLLQVPSMPELRPRKGGKKPPMFSTEKFIPIEGLDFKAIKYRERAREKQRKKLLAKKSEEKGKESASGRKSADSRSSAVPRSEEAEMSCVEHKRKSEMANTRKTARVANDVDEDELEDDYRLLKKVKKGLVTEEEYDLAVGAQEHGDELLGSEDCQVADESRGNQAVGDEARGEGMEGDDGETTGKRGGEKAEEETKIIGRKVEVGCDPKAGNRKRDSQKGQLAKMAERMKKRRRKGFVKRN